MVVGELRELLERHARPDGTTAIDGVRICGSDHGDAPRTSMSGTTVAVIAQGGKRLALGDRVFDYRVGRYLVASVDLPVTGHLLDDVPGQPSLGFGMTLEPAEIAELLLTGGPVELPLSAGAVPPGIEDVARLAGMSISAFHRNFQEVTAMTPIQFQKRIRLQEARLQERDLPTEIHVLP
jgi:AraC-like DNA-binding protein